VSRDWKQRRRPFCREWNSRYRSPSVWLGGRVLLAAPACFGGPAYRAGATKFPSHSAGFGSPGVGASRHAAGILAGADVAGRGNRVLVDRWQGVGRIGGGTQTKLVAGTYVDRGFSWGGFGPRVRWIRHRTVVTSDREGTIYPWKLMAAACLLWGGLGLSVLVARIVQWRLRKRMRRDVVPGTELTA
jgi:hypothetical protein